MSKLTFDALRQANTLRLPQFKNKRGELAHSKDDGSDWTPAQWFQALIGEVGELAEARLNVERGIGDEAEIGREAADVQAYLDIFCRRALDRTTADFRHLHHQSPERLLMHAVAHIGAYANARKKNDRGDIDDVELKVMARSELMQAATALRAIVRQLGLFHTRPTVDVAHPTGVDLGQATADKFNEVSLRVGSDVWLRNGEVLQAPGQVSVEKAEA